MSDGISNDISKKQFNFLSALTAIVVLAFVGACIYALSQEKADFTQFAAAVGAPVGMLLGYWVRGQQ